MKLLSKTDINNQKASETKLEVDEGVKLAKRVDGLRQLSAKEEENLRKFRDESVKAVTEEIVQLTGKKSELENEVVDLETRRKAALEPLTQREAALDERESALDAREETIAQGAVLLSQGQELLAKAEKEIDLDKERTTEILVSTKELLDLATRKHDDADAALRNAEYVKKTSEDAATERLKDVLFRETTVSGRERDAAMVEENNRKDRDALNDRERVINDKYATLLRAEKRHG